jgi:hypothetical protein
MVRSSRRAHDGSTWLSWLWCPERSRAPLTLGVVPLSCCAGCAAPDCRYDRTRSTSSGPGARSARGNAERRSARERHSGTGCSHAPRPGSRRRGSGNRAPSTTTTRNRSSAGARVRQPTQVRTGPLADRLLADGPAGARTCRARLRPGRRTVFKCSASPVSGTPYREPGPRSRAPRPVPRRCRMRRPRRGRMRRPRRGRMRRPRRGRTRRPRRGRTRRPRR